MKKIIIIVLFILAIILAIDPYTSAESVIVIEDDLMFYRTLPLALEKNVPLVFKDQRDDRQLNHFTQLYNGEIETIVSKDFMNNNRSSEIIVVAETKDRRITAMASQIAHKLNANLYYDTDLDEFNEAIKLNNSGLKVLLFGDINIDISSNNKLVKYSSFDQVYLFYKKQFVDSKLTVYIESIEMLPIGTYLAAFRNGVLVFDLEDNSIDSSEYFAWVLRPNDFSAKKLSEIYAMLEDRSSNQGVGLITGNNLQQANLLLARSFFYQELANSNHLSVMEVLNSNKENNLEDLEWTYTLLSGKATTESKVIREMSKARYVKIVAHGSPTSLLLGDGSYLTSSNIPYLKPTVFVAEACDTGNFIINNSIALDIVKKGAVAYIGSFKNGGVTNPMFGGRFSHLLTTENVTISDFVGFHNQGIRQYIENKSRAFLIGDPMWSMFPQTGNWIENNYEYKSIPTFGEQAILPVELDVDSSQISALIKEDHNTKEISSKPRVRLKHQAERKIMFLLVDQPSGIIEFSDKQFFSTQITEFVVLYINSIKFFQGEVLTSPILLMIFFICIGIVLLALYYRDNLLEKKCPYLLIIMIVIVIAVVDYFMLGLKISMWKYIGYYLLFYMVLNQQNIWKGTLVLNLVLLVPILILFIPLKVNLNLYFLMLLGVLTVNVFYLIMRLCARIFENANFRNRQL